MYGWQISKQEESPSDQIKKITFENDKWYEENKEGGMI